MITSTYDPLHAANDLKKAGIAPEHAGAIARSIKSAVHTSSTSHDEFAIKADLQVAVAELRASVNRALWIQGAGTIVILTALRFIPEP